MSKENYESLLTQIEAVPDAETKIPNMPMDTYLQEAENLMTWAEPDQPRLLTMDVDQSVFDNLSVYIGAARYAQSDWMKLRYTQEEATREWREKSPAAEELRNDLEADFRYAFRKRPDLINKVRAIEEGAGNADLVQDLSDLAVLGQANLSLLDVISFDTEQLNIAANKATEMARLLALMNGERLENNAPKKLRDKAYTLLKDQIDQIREAGKYTFRKEADRLKGYRSSHWAKY